MNDYFETYGSEVFGYWTYFKNGKPRWWLRNDYTPLKTCEHCGLLGGPRRVQPRHNAMEHVLTGGLTPILCMACWNRFRVLVYEMDIVRECWKLLNQLDKVRRERNRETNILRAA